MSLIVRVVVPDLHDKSRSRYDFGNRQMRREKQQREIPRGEKLTSAIHRDDWETARTLALEGLRDDATDHWLLIHLALTYQMQGDLSTALKIAKRAVREAPNCPVVLEELGLLYEDTEQYGKAVEVYTRLLRKGLKQVAFGKCGEGVMFARGLLNDVRYCLFRSYFYQEELSRARTYLRKYIKNRQLYRHICSDYSLSEARKQLRELEEFLKSREGRRS